MMKISRPLALGLIGFGVLLVGIALGWAGRGALSYHENVAMYGTYYDWKTACPAANDKQLSCQMVLDVIDPKSHAETARVEILGENGKRVMQITMPYDVLLQPGLALSIGTSPPKTYPYQSCNNIGCLVMVPLDKTLSASLLQAKDTHVVFAGLDNKPVSLIFSMKGYADAARVFDREEAKRKAWYWRMWS